MSNALSTAVAAASGFSVSRTVVNKKTGKAKEVTRTLFDALLTGNKDEQLAAVKHSAEQEWRRSNLASFSKMLMRVFPTLSKAVDIRNAAIAEARAEGEDDKRAVINIASPSKMQVLALFKMAKKCSGSDSGVKARVIALGDHLQMFEYNLQAEIKARQALEAAQTTSSATLADSLATV